MTVIQTSAQGQNEQIIQVNAQRQTACSSRADYSVLTENKHAADTSDDHGGERCFLQALLPAE